MGEAPVNHRAGVEYHPTDCTPLGADLAWYLFAEVIVQVTQKKGVMFFFNNFPAYVILLGRTKAYRIMLYVLIEIVFQ